jgi:hypothetical protein
MRQKANEDPEFERLKAISDLAAIRVRIAAQRLRDRIRFEMRYNPDWQSEPRVPAGQTGGGQWAGGGSILVAANGGGYSVNLTEEEAHGAHVIAEHVGASTTYLRVRLAQAQADAKERGDTAAGLSVGSFTSLTAATKLVNATLAKNSAEVAAVSNGAIGGAQLDAAFASATGYEAYAATEHAQLIIRPTFGVRVIIRFDPKSKSGFDLVTAFPVNR